MVLPCRGFGARIAESMRLSMRWGQTQPRTLFGGPPAFCAVRYSSKVGSLNRFSRGKCKSAHDVGFERLFAVGWSGVGRGQRRCSGAVGFCTDMLPDGTGPRYLMGVGKPDDIVGAVARGILI